MATGEEPQPAGAASLSRSVEKALEEAAGSGVLNLSNRKLRDFPPAAAKHDLSDLTQADLSKNRLSEIPCELCQYISLETLNLYHNCVRSIPSAITNLQALTYLNLSRSQLSVLPSFLCCLPLKVLITSNNKLTSLPENIGCLQQLRELDVSCNEIQMLPSQIGNLESLRDLNLRRNQLVSLPEELSELPLVRLDFSCNKVTRIPVCYRHLRHLQNILLDNNPLQSPPAQICTKGKIHIFKYLNIEACKAVPDLSDLERSIRPHCFSSCLSDELCGSQQHSDPDSGFNSVDSGSKRWSGNESTDEFTDLSLRMVEISREQRQLRDSRPAGQAENSTNIDLELERIEFLDSALDGEEEKDVKSESAMTTPSAGRPPRTAASQEDQKPSRSSYSERLPPNGASEEVSPGKDEAHREGEERRRPGTLQIWQAREKQLQSQSAERRERGASVSLMARTSQFSLQPPNSLSDPSSKAASGGSSGNSAGAQTLHRSDSRPANVSTTAIRPDPAGNSAPTPGGRDSAPSACRPNSFLFRSSTRGNLKSSSVMSPVSPQSPTYTFPEFPADLNPTARSRKVEQESSEQEIITQLRKSIETRLNRPLQEDLGEALNNGVILCQLVNQIRPRSISIIHIPSPAVPKLSLAKSRRNVESFLEACRKIGVPQPDLCLPSDILLGKVPRLGRTVEVLLRFTDRAPSSLIHQLAGFSVFYLFLMLLLYLLYCCLPIF